MSCIKGRGDNEAVRDMIKSRVGGLTRFAWKKDMIKAYPFLLSPIFIIDE